MTIEELDKKMQEANDIILNWKTHNGEPEVLPEAIYCALEENRKAILEYLESK